MFAALVVVDVKMQTFACHIQKLRENQVGQVAPGPDKVDVRA